MREDAGVIRVLGRDISALGKAEFDRLKTRIGVVFQTPALLSDRTVWENVALPLVYHHPGGEEGIRERVDQALEMLLLGEYRDLYPADISLGLQKRAAVARAMVTRPALILMDEPTADFDPAGRDVLLALIGNIRRTSHVAMILVTHDLAAARELESGIGVLKEGELLEPMSFEELRRSQDSFVASLFRRSDGAAVSAAGTERA